VRTYFNPQDSLASFADTQAFPIEATAAPPGNESATLAKLDGERGAFGRLVTTLSRRPESDAAACVPDATTLCLAGNRFQVQVSWRAVHQGTSGVGQAVSITSDTGSFWFFQSTNVELIVKILDARSFSGKFWVFYGALSNVEYTITVRDTETQNGKLYFNPQDTMASAADTSTFP
jgi:hypothetical protein